MAEPANMDQQPNWAFALVHGIGNAEPLEMIQQVSDAIRAPRPGLELDQGAEVHEVSEDGKMRHLIIRHGTIPGAKVRFGTAHWADITYYRKGFVALIGAFLMTAFGVRFFSHVAASDAHDAGIVERTLSLMLRVLLGFMVVLMAVVIFPVTFVSLMFSLSGLVAEYAIRNEVTLAGVHFANLQRWFIIVVAAISSLLYAWVGISRVYPMRKERTLGLPIFISIGVVALAVGALMLMHNTVVGWPVFFGKPGQTCGLFRDCLREYLMIITQANQYLVQRINLVDGIGVYFALLHVLQLAAGSLMLLLTCGLVVVLGAYCVAAGIAGRSFHTMVFATICTFTIWFILLIVLWPENLATYSAMLLYSRPATEVPQTISAMFLRWEQLPWYFYVEPLRLTGPHSLPDYYPILWFEGFYFAFLFAVLALILFVLVSRQFWCRVRAGTPLGHFRVADGELTPRKFNRPRLIVAFAYQYMVLALMVLASLVIIGHVFGFEPLLLDWLGIGTPDRRMPHEVYFQAEWVRLMVIIFMLLFLMLSHTILDGTRLVLDVVNHFTQPAKGYPVRMRIEKRFDEIIERLLARNDKPHLVIIAHSQGTVITLDAMMRPGWADDILRRTSSLTVLTFGSPLSHVYQNYFPRLYPSLAETSLPALAANPRIRWVNAYRIDDYVGTFIENSIPNFPVNVPLPVGGHTRYWERDVMCRVLAEPAIQDLLMPAYYQGPTHPLVLEP